MITFYDLLGIDRAAPSRDHLAAAIWPSEQIQPLLGDAFGETEDYRELMRFLQGCLRFTAVRSSVADGTIGLTAEMHVMDAAVLLPQMLVLAKMPDVAYFLQPTRNIPAQIFVTRNTQGVQVVIQGLPVEIRLPEGLVRPQRTPEQANAGELDDFETTVGPFDPDQPDSLRIVLRDFDSSSVFVRIDARMTPEFDFVIDTHMPITIGPCSFLDLPCEALHDIQLIPSPRLQDSGEIPVEWSRHDLTVAGLSDVITGLITIRAIDLDRNAEPLAELIKRYAATRPAPNAGDPPEKNDLEPIIEDIAFPVFTAPLPVPIHFRLGVRRVVLDRNAPFGEEYALESAPLDIPIRGWHLKIFRFFIQTTSLDEPQAAGEIEAVLVTGENPQNNWSFGLDYSDDGVLIATAIIPVEDRVRLFTILNTAVRLIGMKIGYSLFEPDPRNIGERPAVVIPLGDMGWANRLILLIDLEIAKIPRQSVFSIENKAESDKPSSLHDLGWYLGGLSLGGFYDPDGIKIKVFDLFRIEIEEVAVVSETNGATYLMVSAGIDFNLGGAAKKHDAQQPGSSSPSAGSQEGLQRGGGVHFHRLKFRMGDQNDNAPDFLLDGISLHIKTKTVEFEGFGMLSDHFLADGTRIQEFGFALRIRFEALKRRLDLGFGFFYGKASGATSFRYWMFHLNLGETPLPLGSAEARRLRVLVAGNMRPRLAPVDGNPQPLRLFRWYKADGDVLSLPVNRQLKNWERHDDSFALGAGARFHLAGTKAVSVDIFFFVHSSPEEAGLFAALECYLATGDKPIAYGVLEIDFERGSWAVQIGVNLGLENVLKKVKLPDVLKRLAALTGTLFMSKNIDVIAFGQYADPATWFSVRFKWTTGWQSEIWAAFCIHYVDDPDGPRVFALSVGGKGTLKLGIGTLKLYATGTLVVGRWRNEAVASGTLVRAEAGVKIRVFRVINFGATIEVEVDWLGPPSYSRWSFTFRIHTPWWLPDVSVRFERYCGTPALSQIEVASTPLVAASALPPATRAPIEIGVTALGSGVLDPSVVFHLDQLRSTGPAAVSDFAFSQLEPVAVDSRIALDFKPSVDAPVTVVPQTPAGVGTQTSGKVSTRYELMEIGIRRRKRFGLDAGVWVDLLTPESTHITSVADLSALFNSAVRFEWDVDVIREGRTDTRRLLVNADTAYSFITYSPEGDDVASTTFPGWPCCNSVRWPRSWHEVNFESFPFGVRASSSQLFTFSSSTLHWQGSPPPVVTPPGAAPATDHPVFVPVTNRPAGPIAIASFDERVAVCEIFIYWGRAHSENMIAIEAFDGLALVKSEKFSLGAAFGDLIQIQIPNGLTSIIIRKLGQLDSAEDGFELVRIRYRTVRSELEAAIQEYKCAATDDRVHGGGLLAWLPNRDYEITTRVKIELKHEQSGTQDAVVEQKAYFRTKGLTGLNAVKRVGDELEPYVESTYPGPGNTRLYRREPLAVAFSERFNILVPVNRTPSTAEEANQILEWVLAIEKVGGVAGYERVSQTSEDWVVAHRGTGVPIGPRYAVVISNAIFSTRERTAPSLDSLVVRYEAMMFQPGGCAEPGDGLHPSQVLVHLPVDPGAPDGATPKWEPNEELRVNLRQKSAPFVSRMSFDTADASAFSPAAESGAPAAWRSDAGIMRLAVEPAPAAAQYAIFGENDWRHVQIEVAVDPTGGEAGVAVAVAASQSIEVLLSQTGTLRIIERDGAVLRQQETVNSSPPAGPTSLEVIQFDDRIRATAGNQTIEAPLGSIREGRLALVIRGGGSFTRLTVGGLDAWRCHARTSRYDDFQSHIQSWDGILRSLHSGELVPAATTVANLLANTTNDIRAVMTERSDSEKRQRLFETWTIGLGLPVLDEPVGLSLTRWIEDSGTSLLLLESDEPLSMSTDVKVTLLQRQIVGNPLPPRRPIRPLGTLPPLRAKGVERFLSHLEFEVDRVIAPTLPPGLKDTRWILRFDDDMQLHAFEIDRSSRDRFTARKTRAAVSWPAEFGTPQPGSLGFLTSKGEALLSPSVLFSYIFWAPVSSLVLTDGDEQRALIVPSSGALGPGSYRLQFDIDRRRWRTAVPDDTSSYRASSTIAFTLH